VFLSLIELIPIPGKRDKILELLRFSVDRLRGRSGCLSSGVYEADDENETILYLERWTSEEELHRHIQSNLYLGILNATDLAMEPRGITFCEVSDVKSLDLIVALRTCGSLDCNPAPERAARNLSNGEQRGRAEHVPHKSYLD
jgi:quinol monooxygenase YgiN